MASVFFEAKKIFLDDRRIVRDFDRKRFRVLRRWGSFGRQSARKRYKKRTRSPEPNLRSVLYGLDGRDTVVLGPVGFSKAQPLTVPEVDEFGGQRLTHLPNGSIVMATYKPQRTMSDTFDDLDERDIMRESIAQFGLI